IRVAVIGRDTGTPDRCRGVLADGGFVGPEVVAEPTGTFFSADQLEAALESAMKNSALWYYTGRRDALQWPAERVHS
ncbi:MAG: hypothetical protein ACXU90_16390, partial [Gemmatimonadaceae bacterium]